MRRMKLACAFLFGAAVPALADSSPLAEHWQAITRADVEAAYALLMEDHPALSSAINDQAFRTRWDEGRVLALERADQVISIDGYFAVMEGLANVAQDKHIWWRSTYESRVVNWAGIIMTRRGDGFFVFSHDGAPEGGSLAGARLLSCDSVSADDFAAEKAGKFYAVWSVEAQRIQTAASLLIDYGNPFVMRPTQCDFDLDGRRIAHTLQWRNAWRSDLSPLMRPARNRGAAGYGVREFAGGMWIALEGLEDQAAPVIADVMAQETALRAAPIVVLDMRGNGGGNSDYGVQIARVLFGEARYNHFFQMGGNRCGTVWRVSPRNLETMRSYVAMFADTNPEFAEGMRGLVESAERAMAAGEELTGPATCGENTPASGEAPAIAASGRIVVLTDNTCFSSCLIVTDMFRNLGALHVGQATDAATHYFEVREVLLPSGLSYFSTLQAFSPGSPARLGPFEPELRYEQDISSTAELEAWVARVALSGN